MFLGRGLALGGGDRGLALKGGGVHPNLLDAYFTALGAAVLVRFRLEELTGTAFENTGSTGAPLNGTLAGSATLGVDSGKPGAGKGITCNATDTDITFPSAAAINGLTAFTILAVIKPTGAGEGGQGIILSKLNEFYIATTTSQRLLFNRQYGTTAMLSISAVNLFTNGNVYAVAARLDDSDKIGHIFINGAELTYGTHTTGAGTTTSTNQTNHVGGQGGVVTFDGSIFDVALISGALTDEQIGAHYEAAFLA